MFVTTFNIIFIGVLLVLHLWPLPGLQAGEIGYLQPFDTLVRKVFSYIANFFGMFSMLSVFLTALSIGLIFGLVSILLRLGGNHPIMSLLYEFIVLALFLRAGLQKPATDVDQAAWHLFDDLLAPLFWYVLLGITGCMTYVCVVLMRNRLDKLADTAALAKLHGILAYLPMRLFCFTFALVGNFQETFELLVRQGFSLRMSNQSLLQETLYLQQIQQNGKGGMVLNRVTICWMVVLVLLCLIVK